MALEPGTRLGPYEILGPVGVGGMGEVYSARDPRLGRDVAVKISAERFTDRFEREARAVAALNHPNICTLYDVGPDYLVMELIEGPTLAERVAQGALPVDEALDIARQISAALEAAHASGIIHRDLKPANIKLTGDGAVKVLDFGLAKVADPTEAESGRGALADSPTMASLAQTAHGIILGTAGYMAPEQARGQSVDKRADIWSFGVVLYEMLVGEALFAGDTVSDTLAAVLREDPDLDRVPLRFRRLLEACLQRDPKQRLRDVGDAWKLLDEEGVDSSVEPRQRTWPWLLLTGAAVITAVVAVLMTSHDPGPVPQSMLRFEITPPGPVPGTPSISPDGQYLVFPVQLDIGNQAELWARPMDSLEPWPIRDTVGQVGSVFWSSDSRTIVFSAGGKLRRLDVATGGPSRPLADLAVYGSTGGAWCDDGTLLFGTWGGTKSGGIWQLRQDGGTPRRLTASSESEYGHVFSGLLPDARHFLYWAGPWRQRELRIGAIDSSPDEQPVESLLESDDRPVFVSIDGTGYLLFTRKTSLFAQRFDPAARALVGEPTQVADGLRTRGYGFDASPSGGLVYMTGHESLSRLVRFDRSGRRLGEIGPAGDYGCVTMFPDDRYLAVGRSDEDGPVHVWIVDLARDVFTRLGSGDGNDYASMVSPDATVAFTGEDQQIHTRPANGVGDPRQLTQGETTKHANDWSPDGRWLVYDDHVPERAQDLLVVDMEGDLKAIPFLAGEADETYAQFSPDGKWILFTSDTSGRHEIIVRDFAPDRSPAHGDERIQISDAGGDMPRWSHDGTEIFYLEEGRRMMAVAVKSLAPFEVGAPEKLFEVRSTGFFPFDVNARGEFVVNTVPDTNAEPLAPITVLLNWQSCLAPRAP